MPEEMRRMHASAGGGEVVQFTTAYAAGYGFTMASLIAHMANRAGRP